MLLDQRGVFPIFLLAAIGVAVVAGGAYVVKNKLITSKNGKIVFDGGIDKNLWDLKNQSPKPKASTAPKNSELAQNSAEYKPETGEPKFSIIPPAGWIRSETGGKIKMAFEGSQEDKKEIGNGGYASALPNIQITVEKDPNIKNLDEAIAEMKSQTDKVTGIEIEKGEERKTTLNGLDAYYSELFLSLPNVDYSKLREYLKKQGKSTSTEGIEKTLKETKGRAVSYLLFKDGYAIGLSGVVLASAWDKRSASILASLNSFKFLDDAPKSPVPTKKPKFSNSWTNATNVFPEKIAPVKFSMNELSGWEKQVANTANEKDYTLYLLGKEESETGKEGKILKMQPGVYIDMRYRPNSNLEQQANAARTDDPSSKITNEKRGTFFGEEGYFMESIATDYKTGLPIKGQGYIIYKDNYEISISLHSLQSTWDKWYPGMKTVVDSFKFE